MFDVTVRGAGELERVGRLMKEAGDRDFNREVYRSLNSTVKPLGEDVRRHLHEYLPDQYADELGPKLKVSARRRMGGKSPALYLVGAAKGKRNARFVGALDRGVLRHPLWGNRGHWFAQAVKPGFWSEPIEAGVDKVRRELVDALERIGRKVTS